MMGTVLAGPACSSTTPSGPEPNAATTTTQAAAPTVPGRGTDEPLRPGIDGGGATVSGAGVTIEGFAFKPLELRASAGATITVTNADGTEHSLTAVDGSFDTGRFSSGARTITVPSAGRHEFRCEVHSFMPHGFIQASG